MADEQIFEATTAPALGPGDDDPRSPARGVADATSGPLGPGDDDPRSPAKGAIEKTDGPLGPGDGGDDSFITINPPAPGPGDTWHGPRHVARIPKA